MAFSERLLANPQSSAHAATLAELPDGRIAAAWFAGSAEGARDVAIFMATFDGRRWSEARPIVTRAQAQHDTARLVRKLGNPVLASDAKGVLHLWFVAVGYGGWAGSSINHVVSGDAGQSWSPAKRLITSPFWNLSTLVRTPPLALAGGGWGLPAYHEFAAKRSEWLHLDAQGRVLDKARMPGSQRTLQPAVAALDATRALAMMRDTGPANRIRMAVGNDAGLNWQDTRASSLPNPNASVALLRIKDGRLLLAYNPQTANRNKLALSLSTDAGQSWSAPRLVEDAAGGEEFSYPALLQGRDGTIHLAYTWQRKTIKHLAFSPSWLEAKP
jgi:predicted neuraminidase